MSKGGMGAEKDGGWLTVSTFTNSNYLLLKYETKRFGMSLFLKQYNDWIKSQTYYIF